MNLKLAGFLLVSVNTVAEQEAEARILQGGVGHSQRRRGGKQDRPFDGNGNHRSGFPGGDMVVDTVDLGCDEAFACQTTTDSYETIPAIMSEGVIHKRRDSSNGFTKQTTQREISVGEE
jgi:hypothetical protein